MHLDIISYKYMKLYANPYTVGGIAIGEVYFFFAWAATAAALAAISSGFPR